MKKLPIIVSAVAAALSGSSMLLAKTVLADTEAIKTDVLHMEVNVYDGGMSVVQIDLKQGILNFYPSLGSGGWDTARFVFAQPDYEAGVSLADSDRALAKLGETVDEHLKVVYDRSLPEDDRSTQWWLELGDTLRENKSDRLYYAILHEQKVEGVEQKGTWWERGIIDYRSCVHSAAYKPNTTVCNQVFRKGGEVEKYDFAVADSWSGTLLSQPESETVISWEDEWREIQREQIEAMRERIAQLEQENKELIQTKKDLEQEKDNLSQEKVNLMEQIKTQETKISELEMQLAEQRAENETLKNKVSQEPEVKNETQIVEKVRTEVTECLITENSGAGNRGNEQGELVLQAQVAGAEMVSETTRNEAAEGELAQNELTENESVIKVPMLGEVQMRLNFWWLLIPGVLILGVVVLGLRKLRKK